MNEKEIKSKLLERYVEDLKAGRKPEIYEKLKNNPELKDDLVPLLHILRLQLVKKKQIPVRQPDPAKMQSLKNNIANHFKKMQDKEDFSSLQLNRAVAFRSSEDDGNIDNLAKKDKEALEKLRDKMEEEDNN